MAMDVHIIYKDKQLNIIDERDVSLEDYTLQLKHSIMKTLADIEDSFYEMQRYQSKENWDTVALLNYSKIRHKLLDCANDIERIPANIKKG